MIHQLLQEYTDNQEAKDVIRLLNYTNKSVFLTGKAGTGKSTLLRKLISHIRKNYIILAPTGIAALNVDGQTIHSFFHLEHRPYLPNDKDLKVLEHKKELIKNLDLIIIDEISMVRADLMNAIDLSLRKHSNNNLPFGGKQLLLIGDLFQLPPVINENKSEESTILKSNYSTPYFFSAKSFDSGYKYFLIELDKVYRQKDEHFINLLNSIRENNCTYDDIRELNKRYVPAISEETNKSSITLATTNLLVKKTNDTELSKLEGKEYNFHAEATGSFLNESSDSKLPAEKTIVLKHNARVMMIKNDIDKRWVNGSLGNVVTIDKDILKIKLDSSPNIYTVQKVTWENYEFIWNKDEERIEKKITGLYTQFPIKLAWAVTIHKSQGQTFDNVNINLGRKAFASGQTYVALSRCTNFKGITLKREVNAEDIITDETVKRYLMEKKKNQEKREIFETLANEMQEKLASFEEENQTLTNKYQIIKVKHAQLESNIIELKSHMTNKDNLINTLVVKSDTLQKELDKTKKENNYLKYTIAAFTTFCLYLIYHISNH